MSAVIVNVPAAEPIARVGQTIIYDDPGCYGYAPAKDLPGVVVAVEPSRHHRFYYLVRTPGYNLDRRITERQIIAFAPVQEPDTAPVVIIMEGVA